MDFPLPVEHHEFWPLAVTVNIYREKFGSIQTAARLVYFSTRYSNRFQYEFAPPLGVNSVFIGDNTPVHQLWHRKHFPEIIRARPVCGTFFHLIIWLMPSESPTQRSDFSSVLMLLLRIHGINSHSVPPLFKSPLSEGIKIRSIFLLHAIKDPDGR